MCARVAVPASELDGFGGDLKLAHDGDKLGRHSEPVPVLDVIEPTPGQVGESGREPGRDGDDGFGHDHGDRGARRGTAVVMPASIPEVGTEPNDAA